jgi:hypothetical protein
MRLTKLTDRRTLPRLEKLICRCHRMVGEVAPVDNRYVVATAAQDQGSCTASQTCTQHHDSHHGIMPARGQAPQRLTLMRQRTGWCDHPHLP